MNSSSSTPNQIPPKTTLRTGFATNAALQPAALALSIGTRTWTYAEADQLARRWAARLCDAAGGRPSRVGVFGCRCETSYLGVLAALYAGATFVPLNPRYPNERTRAMLELADVDAVLVDAEAVKQLGEVLRALPRPPQVLSPGIERHDAPCAIAFGRAELARAMPLTDLPAVGAEDDAYLLFTSGSTGRPKGVPISHRNVTAFLGVNQRRYQLTPADRLTQTFDLTFDLSVFDLFMAWGAGAAVCSLQPIELHAPFRFLEKHCVTVWFSVPSVAALMTRRRSLRPGVLPTLRWSLFCGEALPRSLAEAWQLAAPHSTIENLYGPTELTIACSAYRWDPMRSPAECVHELVPIGHVYDGLYDLVVDERCRPVAPGEVGELCVGGPQPSLDIGARLSSPPSACSSTLESATTAPATSFGARWAARSSTSAATISR